MRSRAEREGPRAGFFPWDAFLVLKDILGKMWTEGQNPANV